MNSVKAALALVALASVPPALAAPGRIVLEDPGFRMELAESVHCGAPVALRLTTRDPALLDADTADVQRVVDASLAAIRFRCPGMAQVTVHGDLEGGNRDTFVAVAGKENGWRVVPRQTFRLDLPASKRGDSRAAGGSSAAGPPLAIAGLRPGMSLEAVRAVLASTFEAEPQVRDGGRKLVVEESGCRTGIDWRNPPAGVRPGWRCIEAWFTRSEYPRLYRVDYAEVVSGQQVDNATRRLVSRYGDPKVNERSTSSQGSSSTVHMAWGKEMVMGGSLRHQLQATVRPLTQMTAVDITLYEPGPGQTAERGFQF